MSWQVLRLKVDGVRRLFSRLNEEVAKLPVCGTARNTMQSRSRRRTYQKPVIQRLQLCTNMQVPSFDGISLSDVSGVQHTVPKLGATRDVRSIPTTC